MEKLQSLVIVGVIVAGFAVGLGVFMAFPDVMLKNTTLDPSKEPSTFTPGGDVGTGSAPPAGSPQGSGSYP